MTDKKEKGSKQSGRKEKKPDKEWLSFSESEYRKALDGMVHQNFKTVNTNADAGGIRLGEHQAYAMPYVSLRSLMHAKGAGTLVLDRTVSASLAKIYKQIAVVSEGKESTVYLNILDSEVSFIKSILKEAIKTDKKVITSSMISPRMRQVHLPKEGGGYISVTPVSSGAVANHLNRAFRLHSDAYFDKDHGKENREKLRRIQQAEIPIGGANPVNIGDTVFPMRLVIAKEAPTSFVSIKSVLSLHNKGITDLYIPREIAEKYVKWRNDLSGNVNRDFTIRGEHFQHVKRFVMYFLRLGEESFEKLTENREKLTHKTLLSPEVKGVVRGLIDPAERSPNWNYEFSEFIFRRISALESNDKRQFEYSNDEKQIILTLVRSFLN